MLDVQVFKKLLEEGKTQEAIEFCQRMRETKPHLSFYQFWLDKLNGTTKNHTNNSSQLIVTRQQNIEPALSIPKSLSPDFKNFQYRELPGRELTYPETISEMESEKLKLVKSFPFNGDIYLPTNKIPLSEQVIGLKKVAELVKPDNRAISKNRFEKLKERIKQTGKKRVFILGNGPSLKQTDLSLLKDEITIGFNGIFLHDTFTPTIYVVEDHLVAEDRASEIAKYNCPVKIFPSYLGYCVPVQENTIFLNHLPRRSFPVDTDFSDDVGEISYTGGTVTYTGMQIAASLGFDEIYLIGVDASYKVENVDRSTDYGTGVLCSKSDDVNHFDSRYFGKGYRWHDPNVNTMLQAYRKVRNYAKIKGIKVANATIGGELDVFPRVDLYSLFEHSKVYPKTAVIDFTHIDWLCATGIVKKNMFDGWAKHSLFHVHGQHPDFVSAYQKIPNDCYAANADKSSVFASLRCLLEYNPDVLYTRPTHDRPALSIIQMIMPVILNKPFVIHYMDDWLAKIEMNQGPEISLVYEKLMKFLFAKAAKVLTISQKMADYLHTAFNVEQERLQVVHNYIQEQGALALPKDKNCKVVRYFGGMEPDMSLSSIINVAKAIEDISSAETPVRFEIYTGQNYIDRFAKDFDKFKHTSISRQHDNYQVYLALLESSDLNVLCYNFDEKSKVYLKYSMANKLPETIGANVPFLAIGSKEIGTITYLLEEKYPFVIAEHNSGSVQSQINNILFNKESATEQYFESLNSLKEEFSAARNQYGFQNTLRKVSQNSIVYYTQADVKQIKQLSAQLFELLGTRKQKYKSLKVLDTLLDLNELQRTELVNLMQSHGVDWQFKQDQQKIEKLVRKEKHSAQERLEMVAFLMTSLEHERFNTINANILKLIVK
ncbi:6-hydroxymethylpterin diphosphokinase MptE-like protein [Aliiglaciecola litoralis]|uniref:DUF115 domain-containing protein n=1 Tax=Aliiglaciecola litoralis TaxID=582857 RepID=A0ABP3WUA3_9ALTE